MSADSQMLPPPQDPATFESLCLELWREIWRDSNAQKNGRSGQPQAGVDVFGRHGAIVVGIQCKQKDGLLLSKVTTSELHQEVSKARKFAPKLDAFILATSGPADARVQEAARRLTQENELRGSFTVAVWSWREIWSELIRHPDLLARIGPTFWPDLWSLVLRQQERHPIPPDELRERIAAQLPEELRTVSQGKYYPDIYVPRLAEEALDHFAGAHEQHLQCMRNILVALKEIAENYHLTRPNLVFPAFSAEEVLSPGFLPRSEDWLRTIETLFHFAAVEDDIRALLDFAKIAPGPGRPETARRLVSTIRSRPFSSQTGTAQDMASSLAEWFRETQTGSAPTSAPHWLKHILAWFPSRIREGTIEDRRLANDDIKELRLLFEAAARRCLAVVDAAGRGKTNLLCDFARKLAKANLVLIFSGHMNVTSEDIIERQIEQKISALLCRSATDWPHRLEPGLERHAQWLYVLIDAVNENEDVSALVRAIRIFLDRNQSRRIRLVLSCRDLSWDLFRPTLESRLFSQKPVSVGLFSTEEQAQAYRSHAAHFHLHGQIGPDLLRKLSQPSLLHFFCRVHKDHEVTAAKLVDLVAVFDLYFTETLAAVSQQLSLVRHRPAMSLLLLAARKMWATRSVALPLSAVGISDDESALAYSLYNLLRSEGLLIEEASVSARGEPHVRFVHDEVMEYVLAREWKESGTAEAGEKIVDEAIASLAAFGPGLGAVVFYDRITHSDGRYVRRAIAGMHGSSERLGEHRQTAMLFLCKSLGPEQADPGVLSIMVEFEHRARPEIKAELGQLMLEIAKRLPDAASTLTALKAVLEVDAKPKRRQKKDSNPTLTTKRLPEARFHYPEETRLTAISLLISSRFESSQRIVSEGIENLGKMDLHSALHALEACDLAEPKQVFSVIETNIILPQPEYRIYCAWLLRDRYGAIPARYLTELLTDDYTRVHRYALQLFQTRKVEAELLSLIMKRISEPHAIRPWHQRNFLRILAAPGAIPSVVDRTARRILVDALASVLSAANSVTRCEAYRTMFHLPQLFDRREVLARMQQHPDRHVRALALRFDLQTKGAGTP